MSAANCIDSVRPAFTRDRNCRRRPWLRSSKSALKNFESYAVEVRLTAEATAQTSRGEGSLLEGELYPAKDAAKPVLLEFRGE